MEACLQQSPVGTDYKDLYDLRYFYVDEGGTGRYTCGVAFESMMTLFSKYKFDKFCDEEWYSAVERSSKNPVVQGYLAEHICLCRISSYGLPMVDSNLNQMDRVMFQDKPSWKNQLRTKEKCCLYVPAAYNFDHVDGVILRLDDRQKGPPIPDSDHFVSAAQGIRFRFLFNDVSQLDQTYCR